MNKLLRIRALTGLMAILISLHTGASGDIIVAENFGGTGDDLNSTTADTFASAITSAGGSSTWAAATGFKDDGSVVPVSFQSAYLSMGIYINDAKGTPSGLFTLSATLTQSTTGSWGSIGFFNNPATNQDFTQSGMGLGTLIYRTSGELDGFGGPGTGVTGIDGPDGQPSPQLLTVVLDLTGHDNSTNFGSVSFYQGTADPGNLLGTWTYTADQSFDAIGLSQASYDGTYSGFQLEQTSEPPFRLVITPNDLTPDSYDFHWNARPNRYYDLRSSTSLTDWEVWDPDGEGGLPSYENLGPYDDGIGNLLAVPGGDDARRFFVVTEGDPPAPELEHTIVADNYEVQITNPGFRMSVSTTDGVALPADPSVGLSFLGGAASSSVELGRSGNVATFRVTNGAGQTSLVELETKPHTIEVTVTTDSGQSGFISMRTGSPGPAYGLGDHGGWQSNANLATSQKTYPIQHNGHAYRWLSSFLVFPQQGAAGACFEREDGEVSIGPTYYQMANKSTSAQTFYYYVGSTEEIYAAYRDTRITEGYPGVAPKMDGFELGFETWDLLRWNTNATTCQQAIQGFLDHDYHVRWAVTGSGFWRDDGSGGTSGTTTSFGDYNLTRYPETTAPLPPDFGDWCAARGIRWMIGQRTNFVPEDGPHLASRSSQNGATLFDTSVGTDQGLSNGYFLKNSSGSPIKLASTVFPTVPCYLVDGNVPGAGTWFKSRYDGWGVDGVKEDTMMSTPDHTIYNTPMRAIAEGGDLVMARCGAYSSPGTLTRVNDTFGASSMTQRCPINYLQYAASGAPNVYSDTVGFGGMGNVTSTMRHAWLLGLTGGMAVSNSPWNSGWSAANQAKLKKAIDFHYAIGPYLYSCAVDSHETGYPHTMTPLPVAFPDDAGTYNLASSGSRQFQWMIGPSLLAAPLLHNNYGSTSLMNIYLPDGKWIDIETGTSYTGPTTLTNFNMPLDKTPVFVGGKGVYVSRTDDASPLQAVVFPIANGGSTYTFTHPDGIGKSTFTNNNTGWNTASLIVTDTTTSSPVSFSVNPVTGAVSFDATAGHDFELSEGN
jgi:hypothetical protein